MSQLLRGHQLFCHISGGGGEGGVEKISNETGRGQKKFCDSNENVPDPYHPHLTHTSRPQFPPDNK